MEYQIECVVEVGALVGEGPVWDRRAQILYWTDIRGGKVFSYNPSTGAHRTIHQGVFVGGVRVNRQGGLTFGTWEGVLLWRSDEENLWLRRAARQDDEIRFINEVTAGPDGSFYAGTYPETRPGKLFRFYPNGEIDVVADGLGISNGMGFSPDLRTFYHTDSPTRTIYKYDYDPTTHQIGQKRVFVKVGPEEGIPDGMTVDREGFVWSAMWGGGCLVRFDPDGKEERRIKFPATQTSACTFGGPDLSDLYVSTAAWGTGGPPGGLEPTGYDFNAHRGGALYRVRLDVQGKPEFETDFAWAKSSNLASGQQR